MNRRTFLNCGVGLMLATRLSAALRREPLEQAAAVLADAVASGQVASAVLHVTQGDDSFTRAFGKARSPEARFLLGSITKPICITPLMALFDRGEVHLDKPLKAFLPRFTGEGRDQVTIRHILTHVSGLPDQLPRNNELRRQHAPLSEFIEGAIGLPLSFTPGSRYQYSSMGILLATHVAEQLTKKSIHDLVQQTVLDPLQMKHSVLGLGKLTLDDVVPCQTEHAAPESGAGDPTAREWDWNSLYWRKLGAPWGGLHASASDVAKFLGEFLHRKGTVVKPDTAALMIRNHNPEGLTPRGLGFNVGSAAGSRGCSARTFGHTGSTGTIAWSDPETKTTCVVLTSLPGRALQPHPRELAATHAAQAAR